MHSLASDSGKSIEIKLRVNGRHPCWRERRLESRIKRQTKREKNFLFYSKIEIDTKMIILIKKENYNQEINQNPSYSLFRSWSLVRALKLASCSWVNTLMLKSLWAGGDETIGLRESLKKSVWMSPPSTLAGKLVKAARAVYDLLVVKHSEI